MGTDATRSLLRKLLLNFIKEGKLTTTLKRTKILRSLLDRIVTKAKDKKESNKNFIKRYLGDKEILDKLENQIAPIFSDRAGGFVKIKRVRQRAGDGSIMAKVEWTKPIIEAPPTETKKLKVEKKSDGKLDKVNKKSGKLGRKQKRVVSI